MRALACAGVLLAVPAEAQVPGKNAVWAVGDWDCERRSNDLPRGAEDPFVADAGFFSGFSVTLGDDGMFTAHGTSTSWTGPVEWSASGRWSGGPHHWLAAGERQIRIGGEGRAAVVDGSTGEVVDEGAPAQAQVSPFSVGGQSMGGVVVNAATGMVGPGGIDSFTVCSRR